MITFWVCVHTFPIKPYLVACGYAACIPLDRKGRHKGITTMKCLMITSLKLMINDYNPSISKLTNGWKHTWISLIINIFEYANPFCKKHHNYLIKCLIHKLIKMNTLIISLLWCWHNNYRLIVNHNYLNCFYTKIRHSWQKPNIIWICYLKA